jgi:hypothetical protein
LKQLEDRTLLTGYNAANVTDLVNDINAANTAGGTNTITLTAATTSPYVLTAVDNSTDAPTGLPVIAANDNLTIIGNGDKIKRSTASTTPAFRLLDVAKGATLTLQHLTLQNGLATSNPSAPAVAGHGGAIFTRGRLTLDNVLVQSNVAHGSDAGSAGFAGRAGQGGGIYCAGGSLTLTGGTVVRADQAIGGLGGGTTFGVHAGRGGLGEGGGLYVAGGIVSLLNATVESNSAIGGSGGSGGRTKGDGGSGLGGGVYVAKGSVSLVNANVSFNFATGAAGGRASPSHTAAGAPGLGQGGGLFLAGGTVALANCAVFQNRASGGAGGHSLFGAPGFAGGVAEGGGLYVGGASVTLTNTTLAANQADGGVGGPGGYTFTATPFGGDKDYFGYAGGPGGEAFGGGIYVASGTVTILAGTIAGGGSGTTFTPGNAAYGGTGGPGGDPDFTATAPEGAKGTNGAGIGGGLFTAASGTTSIKDTLIARNTGTTDPDVSGTIASSDSDLIGDNGTGSSGLTNGVHGDQVGGNGLAVIDPQLGPLQKNGGPTMNMALAATSPAVNAGDAAGAPATDQRGFARVVGTGIDIGAYELQRHKDVTAQVTASQGAFVQVGSTPVWKQTLTLTNTGSRLSSPLQVQLGQLPAGVTLTGATLIGPGGVRTALSIFPDPHGPVVTLPASLIAGLGKGKSLKLAIRFTVSGSATPSYTPAIFEDLFP